MNTGWERDWLVRNGRRLAVVVLQEVKFSLMTGILVE